MAVASAFLSCSFAFSAYQTLKTHSVCSNHHQFGHCVHWNKLKTFSVGFSLQQPGLSTVRRNRSSLNASAYLLNASFSASSESTEDPDDVPMPIIAMSQDFDYDVTFVKLSFGDRLGDLYDTIKAILDLGLIMLKGPVSTVGSVQTTTFLIVAQSGHKVEDPDMLEKIRLTIINNLLKYHPESCERLAMGEVFGEIPIKTKHHVDITPVVRVNEDGPLRSLLYIEMADRPGLLLEIVELIGHLSFDVRAAEIVTIGFLAKFQFHVNYKGQSLTPRMKQVLKNSLRFYIRKPETNVGSY